MNKKLSIEIANFLLIVFMLVLSACVKDNCREKRTYTVYEPVYKSKTAVLENIKSNVFRAFENPGKIYTIGNYIFLNEIDKGIHVIDNTNPSLPVNKFFIDIPGNMDMAVKGNILYADMYGDLLALDITDPAIVKVKKVINDVFPERNWGNGFTANNRNQVVVDWIKTDITVTESCQAQNPVFSGRGDVFFLAMASNSKASVSPVGVGGSMARFTIVNDYLYTVDRHSLQSISIVNAGDPVLIENIYAGFDIETIYPFKNTLFLGSMGGMFIFDISNPAKPVSQGNFVHARACDPVIADDDYAYVTLRAGTNCGPTANELQIIDIKNLKEPFLVKTYAMSGPLGLGKDDNLLFICDGKDGLKVYDASDVMKLRLIKTIGGMETFDVIAMNKIALVSANDGLYQYSYANTGDIRLLSKITVTK